MTFKQKEKLVYEYYEWLENMKEEKNLVVKDNALAVINFLDNIKILKDVKF